MGWTGIRTPYRMTAREIRELLDKEFTHESCRVLASSLVGRTYYAALDITIPGMDRKVIGLVAEIKKRKSELWYKEMDETMGPYSYTCPKKIIATLSPTDNPEALKWRRLCLENASTKRVRVHDGAILYCPSGVHTSLGVCRFFYVNRDPHFNRYVYWAPEIACRVKFKLRQHPDARLITMDEYRVLQSQ